MACPRGIQYLTPGYSCDPGYRLNVKLRSADDPLMGYNECECIDPTTATLPAEQIPGQNLPGSGTTGGTGTTEGTGKDSSGSTLLLLGLAGLAAVAYLVSKK